MGDDEGQRPREVTLARSIGVKGCVGVLGVIVGGLFILAGGCGLLVLTVIDNNLPSSSYWSSAGGIVVGVVIIKLMFYLSNRSVN